MSLAQLANVQMVELHADYSSIRDKKGVERFIRNVGVLI
jgi:hypothetical protein